MEPTDKIRNSIIEKLMTITNREYLEALNKLVENSSSGQEEIGLSTEQITMLQMSEDDITQGNLISQEQLDKDDLEWLKNL